MPKASDPDARSVPVAFTRVIFVLPLDDGLRLIRVLHGSRDIPAVFRREPVDE